MIKIVIIKNRQMVIVVATSSSLSTPEILLSAPYYKQ